MNNYIGQLHVYTISHVEANVNIRESFSISKNQAELIYEKINNYNINELFILSTCNRTEFYAVCKDRDSLIKIISNIYKKLKRDVSFDYLTNFNKEECVFHLMKVASGMNSMILGETQITSQIKTAFAHARKNSATGPILNRLIQFALETGKRVRTETDLSKGSISVSYVAVEKIRSIYPKLSETNILLVGAGNTGKLTAVNFIKRGAKNIYIANRRSERGLKLAKEINGKYIPFKNIYTIIPKVDIIVTCTGADFPVIKHEQIEPICKLHKKLLLVDLSVPRNIQSDVESIKNVTLFTIDQIEDFVNNSLVSRKKELPKAAKIIEDTAYEFVKWIKELSVTPTIADLKHLFEDIQINELSKIKSKYDETTINAIDIFSKSLLRMILKNPINTLKAQASNGHYTSSMVDLIRSMYQLDKQSKIVK